MMEHYRIALVGCGRISQSWIEAIKLTPNLKLVSCMDTNLSHIEPIKEMTGCTTHKTLDSMIEKNSIDGAIICTPPATHAPFAKKLLQSNIHVLCEKPLAISLNEGREMYEIAKKNSVTLMMASKFRYTEDIIRAKSMISTGMLGEIHFYQNQFCSHLDMTSRWNADPAISGGGVIMDNGPHSIDLIRYLIGPIKKIHAHESTKSHGLEVEDTSTLSVVTQKNAIATIHLSWALNLQQKFFIEIFGTEGAIKVGWQESFYQQNGRSNWTSFGIGYQKITAFQNQLQNFINTFQGKEVPLITEEDSLASIQLIEAAYRSLKSGQWVEV